jgi:hypothetical protein
MQVIQWAVGGADVVNRCLHLFGAYKYFKLGKITVKMVPASTLPVDPQGLSYAEDDPQTVDPRDQMNPGLVRITNGEDVFTNVSSLSAENQMAVYNSMMLDPRWSKFMLQSGFRRSAYPLYWQVGQLSQDKYPGATVNVPYLTSAGSAINSAGSTVIRHDVYQDAPTQSTSIGSSARGLIQVGHRGKLGWLPTDFYQEIVSKTGSPTFVVKGINNVPQVSVITCCLPKAYKTIYYYRVFITEEVLFTGLRSTPPVSQSSTGQFVQQFGIDQFLISEPIPIAPGQGISAQTNNNKLNNGEKLP